MSVCVAALAADSKAIVCTADKALSYEGFIQWDADTTKMWPLRDDAGLYMIADNGNGPRIQQAFRHVPLVGKQRVELVRECEYAYMGATQELIELTFLKPRLLDRSTYIKAITGVSANDLLRGLADEIGKFSTACDVLVCGFDPLAEPYILDLRSPGVANDLSHVGFQAVGSGWEKAVSRLLFSETKRSHSIARVLYEVFDAKANAEMSPGVGYEWDAQIIVKGKAPIDVPKKIKRIIEQVWICKEQSPFDPDGELDPEDVRQKAGRVFLKSFRLHVS